MRRHWSVIIFVALVGGSLALQLRGAWQDSPTRDEPSHIVDGLAYWQLGSFEFNYPHPPLAKLLPGLSAFIQGARIDEASQAWLTQDTEAVNAQVLYTGRSGDEIQRLIFWSRIPMLLFPLGLYVMVFMWGRRRFGNIPALMAVTLLAFDPSHVGHGPLVNTDVPVMTAILATIIALDAYLRQPNRRRLFNLAAMLAIALLIKFSTLFLIPIVGVLIAIQRWRTHQPKLWPSLLRDGALVGLVVLGAMVVVYRADGILPHRGPLPAWTLNIAGREITPPLAAYARGLAYNINHNADGHRTIFRGQVITDGRWSYFPVALLTKTPLVTLGLWIAALAIGIWAYTRRRLSDPIAVLTWVLPPLIYSLTAISSNLNLGIRHIFPLLPFLALAVAWAAHRVKQLWRLVAAALSASLIVTVLMAYPNTIAYFNAAAGGSSQGTKWFIDSNTDWGQDAWRVRDYLRTIGATNLRSVPTAITLFGTTPRSVLTEVSTRVPADDQIIDTSEQLGRVIISDSLLHAPDRPYTWLLAISRDLRPERIGSTVTVFHFE